MMLPEGLHRAADYEALASERLPAPLFAYLSGGSGNDLTARENQQAFLRWRLRPRALQPRKHPDCSCRFGDLTYPTPVMLAPLALQHLAHKRGEVETAHGAEAADTAMMVSTLASEPLNAIAAQTRDGFLWFQLYLQAERSDTQQLVQRAEAAGCRAIVLTVDASIQMPSVNTLRSGFVMPANVKPALTSKLYGTGSDTRRPDPVGTRPDMQDLQWLISQTRLPVYVKGILDASDAIGCRDGGAAGIVVSNLGGRTIDGVTPALDALTDVRNAVGEHFPVLLDGGIRSGTDVFKALALGADAVLVGRLQVYALAVAGALGVAHMLRMLREELEVTMATTGCRDLGDISARRLFEHRG